ncbi:hypothetical protein AA313_de0210214 [Arthrobotrys entomopaga]|nr:hypothetical protein AA313_de0210214 [Arthrobotrys entomopaga]
MQIIPNTDYQPIRVVLTSTPDDLDVPTSTHIENLDDGDSVSEFIDPKTGVTHYIYNYDDIDDYSIATPEDYDSEDLVSEDLGCEELEAAQANETSIWGNVQQSFKHMEDRIATLRIINFVVIILAFVALFIVPVITARYTLDISWNSKI